ncbi:hypothetical protein KJ765_05060 [Candidatus Micrarchaeota archaeon]|nr:hypothetical protein [Candidatus Micrarchaeota archaeon]
MDDRELKSPTARKLFSLGIRLKSTRLEIGDYIISDQVALERKTAADFESSIIDGRLFFQAKDLAAQFESPIMAIVGAKYGRLQPRALLGAEIALATDFRIPIFHFDSEEKLAEFIHVLALQKTNGKKELALRYEKKSFSVSEQQQFVIESIPTIGPHNAKSLLRKLGTIQRIFTADEKTLQSAEGIGKERAKEIRRLASHPYEVDTS